MTASLQKEEDMSETAAWVRDESFKTIMRRYRAEPGYAEAIYRLAELISERGADYANSLIDRFREAHEEDQARA